MSLRKTLLAGLAGFCLATSFNTATNPLTEQGFVDNVRTLVTDPQLVAAGAVMRPGSVLIPLAIGGAAVVMLGRKKKPQPPKA